MGPRTPEALQRQALSLCKNSLETVTPLLPPVHTVPRACSARMHSPAPAYACARRELRQTSAEGRVGSHGLLAGQGSGGVGQVGQAPHFDGRGGEREELVHQMLHRRRAQVQARLVQLHWPAKDSPGTRWRFLKPGRGMSSAGRGSISGQEEAEKVQTPSHGSSIPRVRAWDLADV